MLQFERELNVINPEEKTNIVSARLLQLNTEYTNAQADRVRKEAAFQSVRGGSFAAAQVSTQGEALKKLIERQNELQEKFAEAAAHYGANHPEYKKAAAPGGGSRPADRAARARTSRSAWKPSIRKPRTASGCWPARWRIPKRSSTS